MTNEEFEKKLDMICSYMKEILIQKNKSYGGASFEGEGIMPILGNMFRLRDKMNRYENLMTKLVEKGGNADRIREDKDLQPFGESLWDTICDIFGYASIGLCILDEKGFGKIPASTEDVRKEEFEYWYEKAKDKKNPTRYEDPYGNPIVHGNDPLEPSSTISISRE